VILIYKEYTSYILVMLDITKLMKRLKDKHPNLYEELIKIKYIQEVRFK
jgi:hypothetical protein